MVQEITTQLLVDGVWTSYDCYEAEGWSYRIGPDVESGLTPNRVELTLANADLSMDPSNVESALYGKIGQNTRARLRINAFTLCWGEASNWEPDSTVDHDPATGKGRAWVALTAEGLLRRLGRWEDPLDSPMTRQTSSYTSLTGHMPLEDVSGAVSLTNLVKGTKAGYYHNSVTLAGDPGAGGSGPCILLGSDGVFGGHFLTPSGNGYQVSFAVKLPAVPSSATYQTMLQWTDTLGRVWKWNVNNTAFQWAITDSDGTALSTTTSTFGTGADPNQWIRYRVKVTVSGSTLTYEPAWIVQDATVIYGTTQTFSSSATGRPRGWSVTASAWTDGAAYASLFCVTDTTLNLTGSYDAYASFNGYLGERAGYRFRRLMTELGFDDFVDGDEDLSAPMGRQKPGKFLDLLEECARTDGGLIYDEPQAIALRLRLNNFLINRPVALALTKGVDVAPPLRKVIGDVGTVNDLTITNWDGTSERLTRDTGRKSTLEPPDGVGRYKLPLAVSCLDGGAQMIDRGDWELAQGTLDRPRYKQVVVNMLASPTHRTAVGSMRPGDVITIDGVEPDTVYLRVISIERAGNQVEDVATLNCLPADIWLGGVYDDAIADSASTTLGVARDTTQTSWTFSTAVLGDVWSTTAEPYDAIAAGERITVTSMGAVTGTGPYTQTATVTRSVNGVVKAQSAGEEIHIYRPGRYAAGGY